MLEEEYECLNCGLDGIVDVDEYDYCPECGSRRLKKSRAKPTEW